MKRRYNPNQTSLNIEYNICLWNSYDEFIK